MEVNKNAKDYTIDELLDIFNLDDDPSTFIINKTINQLLKNYDKPDSDKQMIKFLNDSKEILLSEFSGSYVEKPDTSEANDWYKNQYFKNNRDDQQIKITDRIQQIRTWDENNHFEMKKNLLGVNTSLNVPFIQDTLNPTLTNINTRLVNLDSQFRPNILPFVPNDANAPSSSTNYTIDLTDPLKQVLSLRLFSVQIPNTWYRFSSELGNTCLFIKDPSGNSYDFELPSGNYTADDIVTALNNTSNWKAPNGKPFDWAYNENSAKMEFSNSFDATFYFYDISGTYNCGNPCTGSALLNQNLGWSLGFRAALIDGVSSKTFPAVISPDKNIADAVLDLVGTKYFAIVLDDFNQNRSNRGVISVASTESNLTPPTALAELPRDCSTNFIFPSIPRNATKSQIYSVNQILLNRTVPKQRNYGINSSDVIALLPLDLNQNTRTQPYTVFGVNLLFNERRYFGPVDISRLKIRLIDDKGNTVNLNGADWSFTLYVTELYQY